MAPYWGAFKGELLRTNILHLLTAVLIHIPHTWSNWRVAGDAPYSWQYLQQTGQLALLLRQGCAAVDAWHHAGSAGTSSPRDNNNDWVAGDSVLSLAGQSARRHLWAGARVSQLHASTFLTQLLAQCGETRLA
ncbi:hypothetical protein COO60DRAFT_1541539 [Scenedesmus sp. NREL 46B-D3]|nr:hypothetical protein COO60DRAFT_1541539 [Scenedesmus sp. NREL 46B-D3]